MAKGTAPKRRSLAVALTSGLALRSNPRARRSGPETRKEHQRHRSGAVAYFVVSVVSKKAPAAIVSGMSTARRKRRSMDGAGAGGRGRGLGSEASRSAIRLLRSSPWQESTIDGTTVLRAWPSLASGSCVENRTHWQKNSRNTPPMSGRKTAGRIQASFARCRQKYERGALKSIPCIRARRSRRS